MPASRMTAQFEYEQSGLITETPDVIVLRLQHWNDWFQWRTSFYAYYRDFDGELRDLGAVKIGRIGHAYANLPEHATPLPDSFDRLDDSYVSIGQDESYYVNMRKWLGPVRAHSALKTLGDLALFPDRMQEYGDLPMVKESLLRGIDPLTARSTFPRLAKGEGLAAFQFTFNRPAENEWDETAVLDFAVVPNSTPPTNVHVLIGRNGSGKTTTLREMAVAMLGREAGSTRANFADLDGNAVDVAGLVFVGFSAFDDSKLYIENYDDAVLPVEDDSDRFDVRYSYVGLLEPLEKTPEGERENLTARRTTRTPSALADSFADSAWIVVREKSRDLWRSTLENLESDTIFREANVASLLPSLSEEMDRATFRKKAVALYAKLSSGHKIVLLTVTRLVQTVSDRSMVLLDEPEGHLHPPLLAALIRTLSNLMTERNGIAIVATHSPVILQEVPEKCAWRINRASNSFRAERLEHETFGENVGVLTESVFGLEVADSGFHKLLIDAAVELRDYDSVLRRFRNELGGDARALLHSWFADQRIPITSYDARRVGWTTSDDEEAN